jgi:hypothetical protein
MKIERTGRSMDENTRFRVNKPSVVYEQFDDEFVLINLDTGNYYSFETVGAYVWSLVESGASIAEMSEDVSRRYSGTISAIEEEMKRFVGELQAEGLIVPDERPEAGASEKPGSGIPTEPEEEKSAFTSPVLEKYTNMQDFLLVDPIHEIDYAEWPKKKPE